MLLEAIEGRFREAAPKARFVSLRVVRERQESLAVRRDIVQPPHIGDDLGAMLTVHDAGGIGYAATSDLSRSGLERAGRQALDWAHRAARARLVEPEALRSEPPRGRYESPVEVAWESVPLAEKLEQLRGLARELGADARVLDWSAALWWSDRESLYVTLDGGRAEQRFRYLVPMLQATAHADGVTQTRTFGRHACGQQGGLEVLERVGFQAAAPRIAEEAIELVSAPTCPAETCDVVLAPDQMILQIHESIGHPLELDRILGDERNYAGTSFVTLDMFGSYRYGSKLLNVTFDPTRPEQMASYRWDDDGRPARREYLIRDGLLERPLGGSVSQARAGTPGVANGRASSWNRPPIDRMANLNLEPGSESLDALIGAVERGVYMETNCSWSIDDSRNKFQFSCERGRLIRDGELGPVVRDPGYRGISAEFWHSLVGVGDPSTLAVLGTPNCGKGEPNQAIRVGHASPACRFADVSVFGSA